MSKTGLVLSGGGAKGAYQVGMMKALLEMNVPVDMLAGASIGALNGGILASAPDLHTGTQRLEQVWQRLSEIYPIQMRSANELIFPFVKQIAPYSTYLTFLSSAGLSSKAARFALMMLAKHLKLNKILSSQMPFQWLQSAATMLLSGLSGSETPVKSLCSDTLLQNMLDEFLDMTQLQKSLPLYVSVFEQEGFISTLGDLTKAELLGIDNQPSVFKHIQSLPQEQQKEMLLASAAIPLLYETRQDEQGRDYSDGGQGGWLKSQGNTPIQPLIDAGCDFAIVSHLSNGALWHRHDFPQIICVEIRPNPKLDLGAKAMFDFSADKIAQLQAAGYEDTMQQITAIRAALDTLHRKRQINQQVENIVSQRTQNEQRLNDAMKLLR